MAIWAIVPAAGVGARMMAITPKQYLPLGGRTVMEQTLRRLSDIADLRGIVVALNAHDSWWPSLRVAENPEISTCLGGETRCQSVLNALNYLSTRAHENDWVLVHDAVRPCVKIDDIERLVAAVSTHPAGGILGTRVSSTLKRANGGGIDFAPTISTTVERTDVWQASTPQVFRFGMLRSALAEAIVKGALVTDEASALELAGHAPLLVQCSADNIKITYPEDLPLAELILLAQQRQQSQSDQQERSDVE